MQTKKEIHDDGWNKKTKQNKGGMIPVAAIGSDTVQPATANGGGAQADRVSLSLSLSLNMTLFFPLFLLLADKFYDLGTIRLSGTRRPRCRTSPTNERD
jgi:hypothetical protein